MNVRILTRRTAILALCAALFAVSSRVRAQSGDRDDLPPFDFGAFSEKAVTEKIPYLDECLAKPARPADRIQMLTLRADCAFSFAIGDHEYHTFQNKTAAPHLLWEYQPDIANARYLADAIRDTADALRRSQRLKPNAEPESLLLLLRARALAERAFTVTSTARDYRYAANAVAIALYAIATPWETRRDLLKLQAATAAAYGSPLSAISDLDTRRAEWLAARNPPDTEPVWDIFDRTGDFYQAEAYALRLAASGEKCAPFADIHERVFRGDKLKKPEAAPDEQLPQTRLRRAAYMLYTGKTLVGQAAPAPFQYDANKRVLLKLAQVPAARDMAHILLAFQSVLTKKPAEAIAYADKLIAEDPVHVSARAIRGRAHFDLKNYEAAYTDLSVAMNTYPELAAVYNAFSLRATACALTGRPDKAKSDGIASVKWEKLRAQIRKS